MSTERDEPPDIDVDFEHERREEVMQYLYAKYGRHRCALTGTVTTYRSKGAIREVCKVFGLSTDVIEQLNGLSWGWGSAHLDRESIKAAGIDPTDGAIAMVLTIVEELLGLSEHRRT